MTPATAVDAPARSTDRWMRIGIAFPWLATGVSVLHPSFREIGSAYLARLGLPDVLMFAACAGEVVLACWILFLPPSRAQAALQLALLAGFTAILAIAEPMLLVHPFGVLTKNVPLAALIVAREVHAREAMSPRVIWILRLGIAAIWITEGLFPKILVQQPMEIAVVVRSGLVPFDPSLFLHAMGAAQALSGIGVLLLRGRALVVLLALQAAALVLLPILVSAGEPELWVHPFGPLIKNGPILVATLLLGRACSSSS